MFSKLSGSGLPLLPRLILCSWLMPGSELMRSWIEEQVSVVDLLDRCAAAHARCATGITVLTGQASCTGSDRLNCQRNTRPKATTKLSGIES
jgi:hypothetical protein